METEVPQALNLVLIQTVEQMCRLVPTPDGVPDCAGSPVFEALVFADFAGPIEGRLLLGAGGSLLERIAEGFLEGEESSDPGSQTDSLKELANILCGNLLPYVAGSRAVFRITPPQLAEQEAWAQRAEEKLYAETSVVYETGKLCLRVFVRRGQGA